MDLTNIKKVLHNLPNYRYKQVEEAIYFNNISSWSEATNLPKELREELEQECPLTINAEIQKSEHSKSMKALIELSDGAKIETVLMQHKDGRNTVCVSSQVGCSMGCKFCATGRHGFIRNLSAYEILEQVIYFSRYLKSKNSHVNGVVFMGMGEPFLNYDAVLIAVRMLNDEKKFNIGARHISISTCGVVPGIKALTREKLQLNLALSLHFSNDGLRSEYMPINKSYPLSKLMPALYNYIAQTKRRVMIEYIILDGINDEEENALELAALLNDNLPKLFFVNLINYNNTRVFKSAKSEKINIFKRILEQNKITVTQRFEFGDDIAGACGQLAGAKKN
ncbi:MAG: 23S rRNA (adenine(2503)-C(2))-methyltransferase RlmN [Patescibacteria group bacterium]